LADLVILKDKITKVNSIQKDNWKVINGPAARNLKRKEV